MSCNHWHRKLAVVLCGLVLIVTFSVPALAQSPQMQSPQGFPPNRPQPVVAMCQSALADRVSADAGRRVSLNVDTQNPYSAPNGRQGLRGRLRYGIGGPNTWRTATYECVINVRQNRVELANYSPRASSGGWPGPGGPGFPGGPGGPGYPGGPGGPAWAIIHEPGWIHRGAAVSTAGSRRTPESLGDGSTLPAGLR